MNLARLRPGALGSAAVLLLVAITRWPLAPKYLYYFDSVNFALALDEFNPALHQPQPPGYPLFVGLTRLIHLLIESPERVFLVTGVLSSAAAVLLLWALGRSMFGPAAGLLAAALLLWNPGFWVGGITNQVRLFLAVGGCAVALLAWRAVERNLSGTSLYAAFAAVGIAAGFRPAAAVLLIPLLLWTWWRTHRPLMDLFIGCVVLTACAAGWIIATGLATGGLDSWIELLWSYSRQQFGGSSAAFGAAGAAAATMLMKAAIWNGLGALSWIWAVPLTKGWQIDAALRLRIEFLLVWFLPGFLFSAFIHIGDPDQALGTIPVMCVAGGVVLARFAETRPAKPLGWTVATAVVLNAVLFFVPPGRTARASSYRGVRSVDRLVTSAIDSIRTLRGDAPLAIIHYGSLVSWRQLQYYFPDDSVFIVSANPADATAAEEPWMFRGRKRVPLERVSDGAVAAPRGSRVVCVLANGRKPADVLSPATGWIEHGPVVYSDNIAGGVVQIGVERFFVPAEPAPNQTSTSE